MPLFIIHRILVLLSISISLEFILSVSSYKKAFKDEIKKGTHTGNLNVEQKMFPYFQKNAL